MEAINPDPAWHRKRKPEDSLSGLGKPQAAQILTVYKRTDLLLPAGARRLTLPGKRGSFFSHSYTSSGASAGIKIRSWPGFIFSSAFLWASSQKYSWEFTSCFPLLSIFRKFRQAAGYVLSHCLPAVSEEYASLLLLIWDPLPGIRSLHVCPDFWASSRRFPIKSCSFPSL